MVTKRPVVPPVYRPHAAAQAVPRVATGHHGLPAPALSIQRSTIIAVPPVYRPTPSTRTAQPALARTVAPAVYRPTESKPAVPRPEPAGQAQLQAKSSSAFNSLSPRKEVATPPLPFAGHRQQAVEHQKLPAQIATTVQMAKVVFRPYPQNTTKVGERAENTNIEEQARRLGSGHRFNYPEVPVNLQGDGELHLIGHGNQGGIHYDGVVKWGHELADEFATKMSLKDLQAIKKIQFHSCMAGDKSPDKETKKLVEAREGEGALIERFAARFVQHRKTKEFDPLKDLPKQERIEVLGPYSRVFTHHGDNTSRVLKGWEGGTTPGEKEIERTYGENRQNTLDDIEPFYRKQTNTTRAQDQLKAMDKYLASEEDSFRKLSVKTNWNPDTTKKGWRIAAGWDSWGSPANIEQRRQERKQARAMSRPDH